VAHADGAAAALPIISGTASANVLGPVLEHRESLASIVPIPADPRADHRAILDAS